MQQQAQTSQDIARDAELYRLAQAARLLRYLREIGASWEDAKAGLVDFGPIHSSDGKIVPEPQDYHLGSAP